MGAPRITDLSGLSRNAGASGASTDAQQRELTARGEVAVAPGSESDVLHVVIGDITRQYGIEVPPGNWSPRGSALPVAGDTCLVVFDNVGDAFVPVWNGSTVLPTALPPSGPAGGDLMGDYPNPRIGPMPFAYGYWSPVAIGVSATVDLPIVNTVWKQGGMALSGGGWEVPLAGVYDIQCRARIDGNGVEYAAVNVLVNGTVVFTPVQDNSSNANVTYQYRLYQIAQRWPLAAGDIVTVSAGTAGNSATVNLNGGDGLTVTYCFPYTGV